MLLVRVALLTLAGLCTQGCAVIPATVSLQYHSETVPAALPGAAQVVVQIGVTDVRAGDPRQISNKKNSYGMEMAPIRADRPVDHIVGDVLAEELVKAGFQIGPGPVIVAAEVERFANDYKMGFFSADAVAVVTISVQVRTIDGRILYARTFSADGTQTGVLLMGGHNARLSLEQTLPVIMSRLMTDPAFTSALLDGGSSQRRPVTDKTGPAVSVAGWPFLQPGSPIKVRPSPCPQSQSLTRNVSGTAIWRAFPERRGSRPREAAPLRCSESHAI